MATDVVSLTPDQCWETLRDEEYGRLAYSLKGEVQIVPINYAVDGRRLVFRTGEGSKMSAVIAGDTVAFEIDRYDEDFATSIIMRGQVHELTGSEALDADQLRLRPWIRSQKQHVVALVPSEVSGLRFRLHKPWTSMFPEV